MDLIEFFLMDNKNGLKTKETYLSKNYPILYNDIINFINKDWYHSLSFKEKVWYFINDLKNKKTCKTCDSDLKFKKSLNEGYGEYCSISCVNKCNDHKNKVKSTNNDKYGGDTPFSSSDVQTKSKETLLKKYNVDNIFKDTKYIMEKTILKHGVEHISKLESTKINRTKTNLKKYGVQTPILLSENRNKSYNNRRDLFLDKYKTLKIMNNIGDDIIIYCEKCESDYIINRNLLYHRFNITDNPCTKCHPIKQGKSINEDKLREFITSLNIEISPNNREIIKPSELDIYIPSHNVAIEYNGIYWHSSKYVNKYYHLNKTELCNNEGIKLIHIFEDEWLYKEDIVKSRIKNILGITENKIYARKCEIKLVNIKDKTKFLNENHIQGCVGSIVNLGLYYQNELISIMTFSKKRVILKHKDELDKYELIRFCNKLDTSVVGGASKLLKYFIKNYSPKEIISYADRRWSTGNLYDKLGFKFDNYSTPNFYYVINNKREHRIKYQKHKLIEMGYDKNKTADKIMLENNIHKIYDCGTIRYTLKIN
jgi:hypothetical protein